MKRLSKGLLVSTLLVLVTFGMATAQSSIDFGARGGVGFGTLTNTGSSFGNKTLFMAGLYADMPLNSYSSIQTELNLVSKGAEKSVNIFNQDFESASLLYLQLPLLGKIKMPGAANIQPSIYLGPAFNYKLDYKLDRKSNSPTLYPDPTVREISVSFLYGAGVKMGDLSLDVRYDQGWSPVFDEGGASPYGLYVTLGYSL